MDHSSTLISVQRLIAEKVTAITILGTELIERTPFFLRARNMDPEWRYVPWKGMELGSKEPNMQAVFFSRGHLNTLNLFMEKSLGVLALV